MSERGGRFMGSTNVKAGGHMLSVLHATAGNAHVRSCERRWRTLNSGLLMPGHEHEAPSYR